MNTSTANILKYNVEPIEIETKELEWLQDKWDVRDLEKYGVNYVKCTSQYYIDFGKINNKRIREEIKELTKIRILTNNKFTYSSAQVYIRYFTIFLNFICALEPTWNDLKGLERHHIEKYIEYIKKEYASNHPNSNSDSYVTMSLRCVQGFLQDMQLRELNIAPVKNIRVLILTSDKPKTHKQSVEAQIKYVPDYVLEQLFENINNLHKDVIPIVYTMFKTGLRISDTLALKQDCLVKLNNQYWIETDIQKTYIKGHRIPIDHQLADMLAVLIDDSIKKSTPTNNPDKYIFVRYKGVRAGNPYSKDWVRNRMVEFAEKYNITDELGKVYRFKNHCFRHTFAIKLLNGGADILTVQEILAHASPEMTLRYAKLLDDTKRKVFDSAVKQGLFSFDESDKLKEENDGEIPDGILDMLYTNHKLNAIDTPYGTCMQRKNGKCNYAKQPPCLTCNNGNPCKDLCIGAFEGDTSKYEVLINATRTMIENAKIYNRQEMANENEELLKLYEDIYSKISQGNLIYSRIDKFKKGSVLNE